MFFHWSLTDSKSSQVFRTLLSILADLSNAIVWMGSTSLISKFSSPLTNPLGVVPSVPITTGITVTNMFRCLFVCFFSSLTRSRYLSLFSLSFDFTLRSSRTDSKVDYIASSLFFYFFFFFLTIAWSGRLVDMRGSVCISKSQRSFVSFSRTDSGLCIYYFFVWSNFNFLHNSQLITFPTMSCISIIIKQDKLEFITRRNLWRT